MLLTILLIFVAKVAELTLSTLATLFLIKGAKKLSLVIYFLDIMIYLFAFSKIIDNLDSLPYIISYASGHIFGTWLGMFVEGKLHIGSVLVKIYGATFVEGDVMKFINNILPTIVFFCGNGSREIVEVVIKKKYLAPFKKVLEKNSVPFIVQAIEEK
jgi:uncharacterized protein YebE (UPF0316 family)